MAGIMLALFHIIVVTLGVICAKAALDGIG